MENAAKVLWGRWIKTYLLRFFLTCVVVGFSLWFGKVVLFAVHPYWHEWDSFYGVLSFVDDHKLECGIMVIMTILLVSTIIELGKIAQVIAQITNGVKIIYDGDEKPIKLPADFHEIEMGLRQIQLDTKANAQAAKEANQRKNDMIMYMAHDLKTPLTSVIGYLSLVDEEKDLPEQVRERYVGIALKKALGLEELINGFFDITRFNFTHMILEKTTVNMSMMLSQIVSEFEPVFREKELSCQLHMANEVMVFCDVEKMERVYDNLLKNIANYSYPKSEISITLEKNGEKGMKLITVNKGKTIPKEMLDHIFEQFFRVDSSRNSESGGSGLGLAVTKEIVELHGGTISCESENEEIVFTVTLP